MALGFMRVDRPSAAPQRNRDEGAELNSDLLRWWHRTTAHSPKMQGKKHGFPDQPDGDSEAQI